MKKKIISGVFALALLITAGYGVNKSMKSHANLSDLILANVEALAQLENGCDECHLGNYGREARTVPCKLDLGGGWFTGSVQRVCDITADASSTCTPVECGGYF
ncbi:MAG TPA: hypothetical protein DDW85_09075 [Porphyromonadaceae bacterium]|jgi:hypothetical protein|nr:hypothetical protein [Porphyromonadaceae bacterium]